MLIDSHSHLHFSKDFPDFEDVLKRADQAGVERQILIGCNMADSIRALEFAQEHENLDYTIGIHPHDTQEITSPNLGEMRDILTKRGKYNKLKKRPVAMGEIGLDYFKSQHSPEFQKEGLIKQLDLAADFNLPVVLHVRDAFDDIKPIIMKSGLKKVVFHCFSGGMKEADFAWSNGFLISFTGNITYPKNIALQEVVKNAPHDLYMLETDCPYLAPQKYRGQRNESAYVKDIAEFVAELRAETVVAVANDTTENAGRFFKLKV